MSYTRRHSRPDAIAQKIIDELRAIGFRVDVTGRPADISVRADDWPDGIVMMMELKTPSPAGKLRLRKDQIKQQEFCALWGVPYVTSSQQAFGLLRAFGAELKRFS